MYGYVNAASVTPVSVRISPANLTVAAGQQVQLQVCALDARSKGGPVSVATWTLSDVGNTISLAGLFSATTASGPFTATASVGSLTASTSVTVVAGAATNNYSGQIALGTFTVPDNQPVSASVKRFMRLQVSHP